MSGLLDALSLVLVASGIFLLALSPRLGGIRQGVPVAMDIWMAAGLLRLSGEPEWARIAMAAATLLVWKLILQRARLR